MNKTNQSNKDNKQKETYIKHIIKNAPQEPGIYKMIDKDKKIIYIGKAKNIKKRLQSYFNKTKDKTIKTKVMIKKIQDIKYTTVNTELEATILETNLIKELRPKYNILMKDNKNYVYIKITKEDYPRILITRKIEKDGSKYFGPKTAKHKVQKTLKVLNKLFPYRSCNLSINYINPTNNKQTPHKVEIKNKTITYPCLDYHIKKCPGPCIGQISPTKYKENIQNIINFLQGKHNQIIENLKKEMFEKVETKQFEQAAKLRDKIKSIEEILEHQTISTTKDENLDVINYITENNKDAFFSLFQIREGKIINQENFHLTSQEEQEDQLYLIQFLKTYYTETINIPQTILIPDNIKDTQKIQELENTLNILTNKKIQIKTPKKGIKNQLIELSLKNAKSFAKLNKIKWEGTNKDTRQESLEKIREILKLKEIPKKIECYDISHHGGKETVASMVVFENGLPNKTLYRKFKINIEDKPDDYASMKEALERRLKYLTKDETRILLKKETKTETIYTIKKQKKEEGSITIKNIKTTNKIVITKLTTKKEQTNEETIKLIKKIAKKYKIKRIYIKTKEKDIKKYEEINFQHLKTTLKHIKLNKNEEILALDTYKIQKDESFTKKPNLIIIDGGKGQLNIVNKILKQYKLEIPLISLAKKEEEIFKAGESISIKLDKTSNELNLIKHLRDESHRFANIYREKLYLKKLTSSELDQIPTIGEKTKIKLLKQFGSYNEIKKATLYELEKIAGKKTALEIKKHINSQTKK